jgi:serine/threonine protein kinase
MFGSYRVMDEIGAGRFGPVYRAEDLSHTRARQIRKINEGDVAIKVFDQGLSAEQAELLARALTRLCDAPLDHPSIVGRIGAGLNGHTAWLAEPYVEATPLDVVLSRQGRLPFADVVLRITQVAGALDFAAATGVYHGALHPREILFAADRALVAGLGVVQALAAANLDVPVNGPTVSPQRAANAPVTRADDIYSLAAITFEALYGRPIDDRSRTASLATPLRGVDDLRLREVLHRALATDPAERPQTALEFAKALQECMVAPDSLVTESPVDHDADSALIAAAPLLVTAEDLPLRTPIAPSAPAPDFESAFASQSRTPSQNPNHNVLMLNPDSSANASSERPVWFPMAAMLAVGLLMGFVAGFVVGQRDFTPAPRTAERAVPRAQREAADEPLPTPTVGQDFSESAVGGGTSDSGGDASEPEGRAEVGSRQPLVPTESRSAADTERRAPSMVAAGPASMEVVSRPSGAQVFIDGRVVGRTPLVVSEVTPGDHVVRIALPGHQRWTTTVNVGAGSRARVAASLER